LVTHLETQSQQPNHCQETLDGMARGVGRIMRESSGALKAATAGK
jgi:hypothetical protein